LPGGPVGPASWWAATSNAEMGQRLTLLTGKGMDGGERRERGTKSLKGRERRMEWKGEGAGALN